MKNYTRKITGLIGVILLAFLALSNFTSDVQAVSVGGGSGTITQLDQWRSTTTPDSAITQNVFGKPIKVTGLNAGECLKLSINSLATTTPCSSGVGTSTEPFMAKYFVATSTTATNTLPIVSTGKISANSSAGILLEANNGTDIGLLGAGNTANVTWYGSHNFNTVTGSTLASFGASKTLQSASTDSTLTFSANTLGINLGNSNTWTVMQGFDDSTGNAAYLANTGGGVGGSFTGVGVAGTFSTSNNTYSAVLASNNDFAAGYFSDVSNGSYAYLGYGSYGGYFSGSTYGLQTTASSYTATLSDSASGSAGTFSDGGSNLAYLAYSGSYGGYFSGASYGLYAQDSSGTYQAYLGSSANSASAYFYDTSYGNNTYINDSSGFGLNTSGFINTTQDYYINGSPIGVSHWTNDAGYLSGTVPISSGGTGVTSFGANRIPYINSGNSAFTSLNTFVFTGTNMGVGTSSPWARLSVANHNSTSPLFTIGTSSPFTATTTAFIVDRFGNTGIGTSSPTYPLHVATDSLGRGIRLVARSATGSSGNIPFLFEDSSGNDLVKIGNITGDNAYRGAIGIGTAAFTGTNSEFFAGLDVSYGGSPSSILVGADSNATTRTNSTSKSFRISGAPYTTTAEPVGLLVGSSNSSTNLLAWGGGSSVVQGATQQNFYTAPTVAADGISRLAIFGSGRIAIGTSLVESYSAKLAVVNTDTITDATMELRSMASQSGNILSVRNSAGSLQAYLENTTNPNGTALLRVGRGTNYGNYQERAILGYYSPPDSAAGWDRNQAVIEGVLEVTNASTAFNTYGGHAMYYRVAKSGAGFVENLTGAAGQIEVLSGSGNIGSTYGLYSVWQNASTNTVSEVFGTRSYFGQSNTNTTSSLYGSQIWLAHSGSTNVTNTYGYHIRNSMGTVGTMTNMYGFYMQDFTAKVTNTWGFYILGATTKNYMAGSLGIGVASPSTSLHLIATSNLFRAGYDASNYLNIDVSSTGTTTFDGVGTGASFKFSDLVYPPQYTTAGAPTGSLGAVYFDTTLNKLRVYGAGGWETITSI